MEEGPRISVVIPTRDRAEKVRSCLSSLAAQIDPPPFEVVVVDDGSCQPIELELGSDRFALRIRFVRQVPLGVAAARNLGVSAARGEAILFIDSDCTAEPHLLAVLSRGMAAHPEDAAFQIDLRGNQGSRTGRLEGLRLAAIQRCRVTADGHIGYANTSGFALRRSLLWDSPELFDPALLRGEDSALLAALYERGHVPRYLDGASVVHSPDSTAPRYVAKHFLIGYYGQEARRLLARTGHSLLSPRRRLQMFEEMAEAARKDGDRARQLFLICVCYGLEVLGRACHSLIGMRPGRKTLLSTVIDPVRKGELVARLLGAASQRRGLTVTYATAWTLVQANRDETFAAQLRRFDIVYPDGMGAVLALLCTRLQRSHKVTADDFFPELCAGAARRDLTVALFGATSGVVERVVSKLRVAVPELEVVFARSGYVEPGERELVLGRLRSADPDLILLGMGQPLQEEWAIRLRGVLPGVVIFCVGGLFDLLADQTRRPPQLIRRCGLEWLYRLVGRPGYLWRRYLIGLPLLAWLSVEDVIARVLGTRLGRGDAARAQQTVPE